MNTDLICFLLEPFGIIKYHFSSFTSAGSFLMLDDPEQLPADDESTVYISRNTAVPRNITKALVICIGNIRKKNGNYICLERGTPAEIINTLLLAKAHLDRLSDRLSAAVTDQEAVDAASSLLGVPFFYFDTSYRILAISSGFDFPEDNEWNHMKEQGFLSLDSIRMMQAVGDLDMMADKHDPFPYKSDFFPFHSIVCNIRLGRDFYGRLNMLRIHDLPDEMNKQECRIICRCLNRIASSPGKRYTNNDPVINMVTDLLRGQHLSEEFINDKLRPELKTSPVLLEVCCIESNVPNDPQVLKYYASLADMLFAEDCIVTLEYEEKIVLLLYAPDEARFDAIHKNLSGLLLSQGLKCGASNIFTGFNTIRDHYMQALSALSAGRKHTGIIFFDDIYFDHILSYIPGDQAMAMISRSIIRLTELQDSYQFPLLETLRTYLECSCNLNQTAQKLFLHKNTALYRINHIKEIISADLDDPDQRIKLIFSFKILDRFSPSDLPYSS